MTVDNGFGQRELDQILKTHWQRKEYRFDRATSQINSKFLDLKEYSANAPIPGTAFGAQASAIIDARPLAIATYYLQRGTFDAIDKNIPTFRKLKIIEAAESVDKLTLLADLLIRVPLIKDIPVRDTLLFEKFQNYSWLRWYQHDHNGPLLWNRGYMIIEPYGKEQSLATVYAFHVLKDSEALSWIIRQGAAQFAITHYSNYLVSLKKAAAKGFREN